MIYFLYILLVHYDQLYCGVPLFPVVYKSLCGSTLDYGNFLEGRDTQESTLAVTRQERGDLIYI